MIEKLLYETLTRSIPSNLVYGLLCTLWVELSFKIRFAREGCPSAYKPLLCDVRIPLGSLLSIPLQRWYWHWPIYPVRWLHGSRVWPGSSPPRFAIHIEGHPRAWPALIPVITNTLGRSYLCSELPCKQLLSSNVKTYKLTGIEPYNIYQANISLLI